ncbi:MAG: hypothetical protein K2Q06_03505 [Parvularculaceae bacterium]|nr:hypothetical protein [Parvularculaceae bacterium]
MAPSPHQIFALHTNRLRQCRAAVVVAACFVGFSTEPIFAQEPSRLGIVAQPCPPPSPVPAKLAAYREALLGPSPAPPSRDVFATPEVVEWSKANAERAKTDWANLCRYRAENEALADDPRPEIVFIGDSITEAWIKADPAFFAAGRVDRGISGQTSQQILARFYQDVVALRPKAVHILAGSNDVAGNQGPTRERDVLNNVAAMLDIANANNIKVILGAIPPASDFYWRPGLAPAAKIEALNAQLRDLAHRRRASFVDYHAALAGEDGGMRDGLSYDGVHPNRIGYGIMAATIKSALADLRK